MILSAFLNTVAQSQEDILEVFLDILSQNDVKYCAIGGLAVNAYAEPVVSLDLDVVVAADKVDDLIILLQSYFTVTINPHSINISSDKSDLRIQVQTDPRYQDFISRAAKKKVLGYEMQVAAIEDVLQGKVWAYLDDTRRASKRQKDLADIFRLVEVEPELKTKLPEEIQSKFS